MELVEDSECRYLVSEFEFEIITARTDASCSLPPRAGAGAHTAQISDRRAQNAEFAVTSSRNRWNHWETTPDIISSISCFIRARITLSIQSWNVFITGAAKLMERRVRIAASW
jgi:hypothetical protein